MARETQSPNLYAIARDLAGKAHEQLGEAHATDSETARKAHLHAAGELIAGVAEILSLLGVTDAGRWRP